MEQLQRESLPDNLTAHVLSALQLAPLQRQQLALAYKCTQSQRTTLLQQQECIIKELQGLLAAGPFQEDTNSGSMCPQAGGLCLSNDAPPTPQLPSPSPSPRPAHAGIGSAAGLQSRNPTSPSSGQQRPAPSGGSVGSGVQDRSSRCSSFSSAYSSLHMGLLDLELAQKADDLLQELQRLVRLNREVARSLIHGGPY